jgi:hypothetical protein
VPASERSLRLTNTYRDRLAVLSDRISAYTATSWQHVTVRDLDRSHDEWLTSTVLTLEQAQRAGVALTLAYLASFIASETGQRALELPKYDPARAIGFGEDGQPLAVPLQKTLIGVKSLMKDGRSPEDALTETGHRAERLAAGAVMAAPRTTLADQVAEHPAIVGWRRVTRGGCGACLAAAAHAYADEPMRVHAHCHCSQEPIIRDVPDRFPRETGPEIFARMSRVEQDQALGSTAAQAVRAGAVAWPELIQTQPMTVGADWISQAPDAALT